MLEKIINLLIFVIALIFLYLMCVLAFFTITLPEVIEMLSISQDSAEKLAAIYEKISIF